MEVANIEADLYKYLYENMIYDIADYQVLTMYIDSRNYDLIVRRLDKDEGWSINLNILIVYLDQPYVSFNEDNRTNIINIGDSVDPEKIIRITINFDIIESNIPVNRLPIYNLVKSPDIVAINREEFNKLFDTNVVCLSKELYAAGLHENKIYLYSDFFLDYYEIIKSITHIVQVALTFTKYDNFHFVISAYDGFMMNNYVDVEMRNKPRQILDEEFKQYSQLIKVNDANEYPIFYKNKCVLAQCNMINMPKNIFLTCVNRYYFFHNLYNSYRSWNLGKPFHLKQNKIAFGASIERSSQWNFKYKRFNDSEKIMNQREYFISNAVPKDNIHPIWNIYRTEQINFKYILEIDGESCTWDATAWKLNSGSVIFKVESIWQEWWYEEYKPFIHYIPIKDDFSDLQEKYHWCESHQEECEIIIKNAKMLFQKIYRFQNVIENTLKIVNIIANSDEDNQTDVSKQEI